MLGAPAVEQARQLYSPLASSMRYARDIAFGSYMRCARLKKQRRIEYHCDHRVAKQLGAISLLRSKNITPSECEAYHLNRICVYKCSACQEKRIENVKSLYPFPVSRAILLYRRHPFVHTFFITVKRFAERKHLST